MKKYLFLIFGAVMLAGCHHHSVPCSENRANAEMPVFFDFGSYEIRPEFAQQLDNGLIFIKGHRFKKIFLDGYADERGPNAFNVELSKKRVMAVRDYLVKNGVDDGRIVAGWHGVEGGKPYGPHRVVRILFE